LRKRYVIDAGALALYFAGSKDVKYFIDEVYSGGAEAFMCEVNVAEFLYNYARVFSWESALVKHALLRNSPISILSVDESLTTDAAKLKLRHHNRLSLVECYLIALAKQKKAKIITTGEDVEKVGEVPTVLLQV